MTGVQTWCSSDLFILVAIDASVPHQDHAQPTAIIVMYFAATTPILPYSPFFPAGFLRGAPGTFQFGSGTCALSKRFAACLVKSKRRLE